METENTYLVHHHDTKEIANGREEESIQIVLDLVADGLAEDVETNLTNDEKEDAENDISKGPAVFKGPHDKKNLAAHIDEHLDGVDNVEHNEYTDGMLGVQAPVLESEERHGSADDKHGERG